MKSKFTQLLSYSMVFVWLIISATLVAQIHEPKKNITTVASGEEQQVYGDMTRIEFHKKLDEFIKQEETHTPAGFLPDRFVNEDCETKPCKTFYVSFSSAFFNDLIPDKVIFINKSTGKILGGIDSRDFVKGMQTGIKLPIGEYIMIVKHHMYEDGILKDVPELLVTPENVNEIGILTILMELKGENPATKTITSSQGLHIMGHIADAQTGKPLKGVKVSVKEFYPNYRGDRDITAVSDEYGYYFSEKTIPFPTEENIIFDAEGYSGMQHEIQKITLSFEYPGYENGKSYFGQPISPIVESWNKNSIFSAVLMKRQGTEVRYDLNRGAIKKLRQTTSQTEFLNRAATVSCDAPSTIKVGLNCTNCNGGCTQYVYTPPPGQGSPTANLPFEKYVRSVLVTEWLSENWGQYSGAMDALYAGAIAIRTVGAYWKNKQPQLNANYNIGANVCWQVFYSSTFEAIMSNNNAYPKAKSAVEFTSGWFLRKETSFPKSEFAAETNDNLSLGNCNSNYNGTSCGDGHFRMADQISSTCYPLYGIEYVSLGFSDCRKSHPRGMSQRGSFRWASERYISNDNVIGSNAILPATFQGINYCKKSWQQILGHYYPYYKLENCSTGEIVTFTNVNQFCVSGGGFNCNNAVPLSNGVPYIGSNSGGGSNVTTYNCSNWAETGPEKVHSFVHLGGTITINLVQFGSVDVDAFLLGSCSPSNCLLAVDYGTVTTTGTLPLGVYYIVVDGYQGAVGSYSLTVSSSSGGGAGGFNCNNPVSLSNGVPYNGNNSGGVNNVSVYNCTTWSETGPEKVHSYYHSGGNITMNLAQSGGIDVDAFLLGSCSPNNCILPLDFGIVTTSGSQPPGTYYVVVDGYQGAVGNYTLTVSSSVGGGGGGLPNLVDNNSSKITSGRSITITAAIKNIGSAYAGPASFRTFFVLSLDPYIGNDYPLGYLNYTNFTIPPGGTNNYTFSWTIPNSIPAGTYYLIETLDYDNSIIESDDNNSWYFYGTFYVPPGFAGGGSEDNNNIATIQLSDSLEYNELEIRNHSTTSHIQSKKLSKSCEVSVRGFNIDVSNVDFLSEYLLYNALGDIISKGNANAGSIQCRVNVPGIYFISIVDGSGNKCVQKVFVN